jgi:molecular chaperone DnaJ
MDDLGDMFGGFGDIFGFSQGRGQKRSHRGSDLEMNLTIDFMEAVFGCEKEINYSRLAPCSNCGGTGADNSAGFDTCSTCDGRGKVIQIQRTILGSMQMESLCPHCHGEGKIPKKKCSQCNGLGQLNIKESFKVKVPAGIDDGESIRLQGKGQAGSKGAAAGDLFLRVRVKDSKKFDRRETNIYSKQEINIRQAILGDKIEVETVDGTLKLTIPEGTQSGTVFRLKEHGVPGLHGRSRGDHFLEVIVRIPKGKKGLKNLDL